MWMILRQTFREWQEDKVPVLAYYTVFSLAPLLLIVTAVAGLVFDRAQAQERILAELGGLVGQQGRELITSMLEGSAPWSGPGWRLWVWCWGSAF